MGKKGRLVAVEKQNESQAPAGSWKEPVRSGCTAGGTLKKGDSPEPCTLRVQVPGQGGRRLQRSS